MTSAEVPATADSWQKKRIQQKQSVMGKGTPLCHSSTRGRAKQVHTGQQEHEGQPKGQTGDPGGAAMFPGSRLSDLVSTVSPFKDNSEVLQCQLDFQKWPRAKGPWEQGRRMSYTVALSDA